MGTKKFKPLFMGIILVVGLMIGPTIVEAEENTTSLQKENLEKVIRQYIMDHPEVIVESLDHYQKQQEAEEQQRQKEALLSRKGELLQDPTSPVIGAKSKSIDLVEFFDYRCGYCKKVHATVLELPEKYPRVRLIFKEFPILGSNSHLAARAALAAHRQGRYLAFHRALMGAGEPISAELIDTVAQSLNLNVEQLHQDMKSPSIQEILDQNHDLARAIGVRSTPSFVIGDKVIPGALDPGAFDQLIAEATAERTFSTIVSPEP